MTNFKRFLPQVLLLGSLGFSAPLSADETESNAFIISSLAGDEHPRTRNEKAHLLFRDGEFNKSAKIFEALLTNDPTNAKAWFNLGVVQLNLGNSASAIQSFHAALKLGMGTKARFHLAYALVNGGEVLGAMHHLKTLLRVEEKHELAWTLLGRCYETYSRFAQAKECYQKALAINPNQGKALFFLENLPKDTKGNIPNLSNRNTRRSAPQDETSLARSASPLPLSRVLNEMGKATQAHMGALPPLHQTYHLSSDLPNGVKLIPTKEADWTALKKTSKKSPVIAPTVEPPKVAIPIEDLDI
jgi:tetratricopeptide (TPR) repeat protein